MHVGGKSRLAIDSKHMQLSSTFKLTIEWKRMPCDFPRSKIRFWHTPALRDGTQILPNPFHTTMPQTAIRAHEDDDDPPILEPRTPAPVTTPVNSFWQNTSDSDPTWWWFWTTKEVLQLSRSLISQVSISTAVQWKNSSLCSSIIQSCVQMFGTTWRNYQIMSGQSQSTC